MGYEHIKVEREGRLTIVSLDRPEAMNALHAEAHWELHEAFDDFAQDPEQWVAILTAQGRAFCAGNDLKRQAGGGRMDRPPTGFAGLMMRSDLDKPVIAAVNGLALGGGFETALACDLIIAAESAAFGLPEPRVGLAALAGGLIRLPQSVGVKRAMGMILTARRVSAGEGLSLGFVNAVVPDDQLMAEARRWADEILACSPIAIRAAKQVVYRALDEASVADALVGQREYPAVRSMFASEDFKEGPRAFAEKRTPQWTGR